MAYRIGRQKEENKGLLRGNVIRTQLNNIMSYKCVKYRAITWESFREKGPSVYYKKA